MNDLFYDYLDIMVFLTDMVVQKLLHIQLTTCIDILSGDQNIVMEMSFKPSKRGSLSVICL